MVHFFSEILNQNFNPNVNPFVYFYLIKNYAKTILITNEKNKSQDAF